MKNCPENSRGKCRLRHEKLTFAASERRRGEKILSGGEGRKGVSRCLRGKRGQRIANKTQKEIRMGRGSTILSLMGSVKNERERKSKKRDFSARHS